MDGVLCDFHGAHKKAKELNPDKKYPQSEYDFFRKLEPIIDSIDSIRLLQDMEFDVYILTAPSVYNPMCYTEKRMWVEDHFGMGMVEKLIISPNKGLNKGDFLIDDFPSGRGQDTFEGELIHFGSDKFPNWEEVIAYLEDVYLHI